MQLILMTFYVSALDRYSDLDLMLSPLAHQQRRPLPKNKNSAQLASAYPSIQCTLTFKLSGGGGGGLCIYGLNPTPLDPLRFSIYSKENYNFWQIKTVLDECQYQWVKQKFVRSQNGWTFSFCDVIKYHLGGS